MKLPFDTQPKPETHKVGSATLGSIELPKLYSVTPKEEIEIAESLRKAGAGNDVAALNRCRCEIAALAIKRKPQSRDFDPTEVTPEGMADQPLALVEQLFTYMLGERRGWRESEPDEEGQKKSNGVNTSTSSNAPSPTITTASVPDGRSDTTAKPSATSRSAKSAKATKPTSNSEL